MKHKLFVYSLLSTIALSLLASASFTKQNILETNAAVGNYSTSASTYYNNITATSGKQLAGQLHDLITSTHYTYPTYADNGGNGYQKNTDQYYEGTTLVSGQITEFYTGVSWPNGWYPTAGNTSGGYNREHCWCQSLSVNANGTQMWGETGGGADMHHLRPVEVNLNTIRNNHLYGEIENRDNFKKYAQLGTNKTYALGGYMNGDVDTFEPLDSKKGDVARIIFYVYLHYNSYTIADLFGGYATTNGSASYASYFSSSLLSLTKVINKSTEAAALEMLLDWNTDDPVDDSERRRNEQVATYQGNRNPFIDNSNYANMIWGDEEPTEKYVPVNTANNPYSISEMISYINDADTKFYAKSNYFIKGNYKSTITAYSETYKNMTVDITDGTNDFRLYRMTTGSDISFTENEPIIASTTGEKIILYESTTYEFNTCTLISHGFESYGVVFNTDTCTSMTSEAGEQEQYIDTVNFSFTKGVKDYAIRMYKNSIVTFTSPFNIVKIEFTCTVSGDAQYGPSGFVDQEGYSYTGYVGTWLGSAKTVVFDASNNQVRATQIKVYIDAKSYDVWCEKFIHDIECDNGVTAPDVSSWNSTKTSYLNLSEFDKNFLKTYSHDALNRYDFIIAKYGTSAYENFIGRTVSSAPKTNIINVVNVSSPTVIIIVVSLLGLTSIGGYFFYMKRKED